MSDYVNKNELQKIDDLIKAEEIADANIKEEFEGFVQCQECGKEFDGLSDLQRHIDKDHDKRLYMCTDCGTSIEGNIKFLEHKRRHEVVTCNLCSKTIQKAHFPRHLESCGGKDKNKFQCDQCGYQTNRSAWSLDLF